MSEEQIIKIENLENERKSEIINYLQNKYNESFEIISKLGQSRGLPGDLWGVKSCNNKDTFTVTGNITDDGYAVKDSYFRIYILPYYTEYVKKIINKEINTYLLTVDILKHNSYADGLTKDVSAKNINLLINSDELFKAKLIISITEDELNGRSIKDVASNICNEMAGAKLNVWIICRVISKDMCNDNNMSQHISKDTLHPKILNTVIYYTDEYYHAKQREKSFKRIGIPEISNASEDTCVSVWQLERLCCLVYLDSLLNNAQMGNLYEILSFMMGFGYDDSKICGRLPSELTKEEWDIIIMNVLTDPYCSRLTIVKYIDINEKVMRMNDVLPGHKAVCFMDEDKNAIVIFRGTYGDEEWMDNAYAMLESDSKQQIAAAEFVRALREDKNLGIRSLTVAGHSKGGNKAQYVTVVLPENYVDRCLSINGQGFSPEFVEKYKDNIAKRKSIIELIAERRDFVNSLGIYLNDTIYFEGRRGEHTQKYPYGQPIVNFHYPDSLRKPNGEIGIKSEKSMISNAVNSIAVRFLTEDKFKNIKKETAINIISLMMTKNIATYSEIAEAIKNLVLVFFEMVSNEESFNNCIPLLIYEEADVLIATIGIFENVKVKSNEEGESGNLRRLVEKKLALSFVSDTQNIYYFNLFLKRMVKYLKGITHELKNNPDVIDYLYIFINSMLSYMKKNSTASGKLIASRMESSFLKLRLNIYDKSHEELFEMGINSIKNTYEKKINELDFTRYIGFSINAYKRENPKKEELLDRKIYIVKETIKLTDEIFNDSKVKYELKKGNIKKLREFWTKVVKCIKINIYLCKILEEESIYMNGEYLDNPKFLHIYKNILDRIISQSSSLTAKATFL